MRKGELIMKKKTWLILGMAVMLSATTPVYAKKDNLAGVEQSMKTENFQIEIGDALQERLVKSDREISQAPQLYSNVAGVNYYSQLSNDEKMIYDQLKEITISQNQIELQWPKDLSFVASTQEEYEEKRAEVRSVLNWTLQNVVDALSKDYPELYWLDISKSTYSWKYSQVKENGKIYYNMGQIYYNIVARYTEEEVTNLNEKLDTLHFEGNNRYQVVKAIHDYLCENVVYSEKKPHVNEPYGAFIDGIAVCEGYGEAFKWLCDREGIPCVSVIGTASREANVAHLWNYVQMEDGKWYAVDVTWDDLEDRIAYTYFLVGSETTVDNGKKFFDNHKECGDFSGLGYKEFIYPQLSESKYYQKDNVEENSISYSLHVQDIGWMEEVSNGESGGTIGKSKRVEAIRIHLTNQKISGGVEYTSYVNGRWQPYVEDGAVTGTTGKSFRLEALKVRLTGEMDQQYDVYYRVHAQDYGWLGWASNGAESGTTNLNKRLEAIQIRLVPKGEPAPGNTKRPFIAGEIGITYSAHVQNIGWQEWKLNGERAGTSGKSLRLEAIKIALTNSGMKGDVEYRTHMQNIGWKPWVSGGKVSGQTGKGLRMEAVQIRLTDELADNYNVIYRAHVQNIGWQEWVSNGQKAGTSGKSLRVEGIEIRLERK